LQTIRADDLARRHMLDEQVIADFIKRVGVQSRHDGFGEALVQFEIEDGKTQSLGGTDFARTLRQTGSVFGVRFYEQPSEFKLRQHGNPFLVMAVFLAEYCYRSMPSRWQAGKLIRSSRQEGPATIYWS
jgi:hypothetical protein